MNSDNKQNVLFNDLESIAGQSRLCNSEAPTLVPEPTPVAAIPVKNKGGRPRKDGLQRKIDEKMRQMDDLFKEANPSAVKQRILDRQLETLLTQQQRVDRQRRDDTAKEGASLKSRLAALQAEVAELNPKAQSADSASKLLAMAKRRADSLEHEADELRSELKVAQNVAAGLQELVDFILAQQKQITTKTPEELADAQRVFGLKFFLTTACVSPEPYAVLGIEQDELQRWSGWKNAYGSSKESLLNAYENFDQSPTADRARWFVRNRLRIEFGVDVEAESECRKQQQREAERLYHARLDEDLAIQDARMREAALMRLIEAGYQRNRGGAVVENVYL